MYRHHEHGHRHRRMGPIGSFVRTKLRRRLFVWFLGGVFITGLVVSLAMILVARVQEPEWARTWEGTQGWVGKQFAMSWKDPVARERYAREAAADLGANIDLYDSSGQRFFSTGAQCRRAMLEAPVFDGPTRVGAVRLCLMHNHNNGLRWALACAVLLLAMWKLSGKVARRLASPLDELTDVVRRIGQGDLKARAVRASHEPDEIGVVSEAVNEMAARIEKQMADQRELLATVSHELRTPLARLRIISEIARDTGATPRTFDELDREVVELDTLAGELLASSRLEFGQLTKRALSVRDLAARAVERAGLQPTVLAVNGEGDSLSGDPTLLARALANLLDNARKHANGAEQLEVTVAADEVRFEVLDRGPGISGDGAALFEKFNRGQNGEGADGLGLGLALVKRIVVAHGGGVWAQSRDGGGARVGFSVKRA